MTDLAPHKNEPAKPIQSDAVSAQVEIAALTLLGQLLRRSASPAADEPELERPNFLTGYPSFLRTPIHD